MTSLFVVLCGLRGPDVSAIVLNWDGSSNGLWSQTANWVELDSPDGDDLLVFSGVLSTGTTNDLAVDTVIEGIELTNMADGESFSFIGSRVQLTGDIETTAVVTSGTDLIEDTFGLDIVLASSGVGFNTGLGHNVYFTGEISGSQALEINNGSNDRDDGQVTLAGINTYTGGTTLMGGTLVVSNDAALGTGALTIEDRSDTNPVLIIGQAGLNLANSIVFENQGSRKVILFDIDDANTNSAELSGDIVLNETNSNQSRIAVGSGETLTLSGVISGAGGFSLRRDSTGGTLVITGNNTFSGGFRIEEGTVYVANNNALGTGLVTIQDRGVNPVVAFADGIVFSNDFEVANQGGAKTLAVSESGSAEVTLNGSINITETRERFFDVSVDVDDTLILNGLISGVGTAGIEKTGAGTLILSNNANDFVGNLYINRGTAEVETIGDIGVAGATGAGSLIVLGVNNNDGVLNYVGSGAVTNRQFSVGLRNGGNNRSGGGSILSNGTGALVFTNSAFNVEDPASAGQVAERTLTLGGDFMGGANEIQGAIIDNRAQANGFVDESVSLVKTGAGVWVLSGTNLYTGTTDVQAGTLFVNGDSSGASGAVTVDAGATLGGSGMVGGALQVSGNLAPGTSTLAAFTAPSAGFVDGSAYQVNFDSSAPVGAGADLLVLTGDLSLSGSVSLELTDLATSVGALALGTVYTLINYDGAWNGGTFEVAGLSIADGGRFNDGVNEWELNYDDVSGGLNFAGSQIAGSYVTVRAVPELRSYALLLGLFALGLSARRRR